LLCGATGLKRSWYSAEVMNETDHGVLFVDVSERRAVDLTQPEIDPTQIRIAAQITEVLRSHKRSVVLSIQSTVDC